MTKRHTVGRILLQDQQMKTTSFFTKFQDFSKLLDVCVHKWMQRAKSFYCFSPWEKAGLCFQCILKSILHEKTTNELLISLYTLLCACNKHLCMWPCNLTENFSECRLFYTTEVFSVR